MFVKVCNTSSLQEIESIVRGSAGSVFGGQSPSESASDGANLTSCRSRPAARRHQTINRIKPPPNASEAAWGIKRSI